MGDTSIEWTDKTWNPVTGCERISPGCAHCYAKDQWDRRHTAFLAGKAVAAQYSDPFEVVKTQPGRLLDPLSWRAPARVFVNSVSDLFHEDVPDAFVDKVFAVMALASKHTFQVLTKRPERMRAYCSTLGRHHEVDRVSLAAKAIQPEGRGFTWTFANGGWHLPNVWLGVSVENQHWGEKRITQLLATPAAVRFISAEPLLGVLDLRVYLATAASFAAAADRAADDLFVTTEEAEAAKRDYRRLDWVIGGFESGARRRPGDIEHARALRDQCVAAGVPFLWKQNGGLTSKTGGRLLDGRTWDEFPTVAA